MTKEKQFTKDEMRLLIKEIIKELPNTPSDETCERLDRLEFAFFGNPKNKNDLTIVFKQ